MPVFNYGCRACGATRRVLAEVEPERLFCDVCDWEMERAHEPPTTVTKEVLDNGWMARRVERWSDAERIFKERSRQDRERNST